MRVTATAISSSNCSLSLLFLAPILLSTFSFLFLVYWSLCLLFFFFSSRRRHTRWTGDWSSDVCSSDLRRGVHRVLPLVAVRAHRARRDGRARAHPRRAPCSRARAPEGSRGDGLRRSEERRVGKEGRSRGGADH